MENRCSFKNGQVIHGSCDYITLQCKFFCSPNYHKTGSYVYCNSNMWRTKDGDPCIVDRGNNFLTATTMQTYWPDIWNTSPPTRTFSAHPQSALDSPVISTMGWNQNLFLSVVVGGLILLIVALILLFVRFHRKLRKAESERNDIEYANRLCSHQELVEPTSETEIAQRNLQISSPPAYVDLRPPTYECACSLAENVNRSVTSDNKTQTKSNTVADLPPPYAPHNSPPAYV